MSIWHWWNDINRENWNTRRKPVPMSLDPPRIILAWPWDWTGASALGDRWQPLSWHGQFHHEFCSLAHVTFCRILLVCRAKSYMLSQYLNVQFQFPPLFYCLHFYTNGCLKINIPVSLKRSLANNLYAQPVFGVCDSQFPPKQRTANQEDGLFKMLSNVTC